MVDNPSKSRVGWSFLDDERSRFAMDGQWWLYERMYHERQLREQFTDQGEGSSLYRDSVLGGAPHLSFLSPDWLVLV